MNAVANAKTTLPNLKNDGRMHVHLSGNHFQRNVGIPNIVEELGGVYFDSLRGNF